MTQGTTGDRFILYRIKSSGVEKGSRNVDRKERRPRKVDLRKINLTEFRPTRKFAHLKIAPRNIDLTENSPNRNLARMENRPIGKVT